MFDLIVSGGKHVLPGGVESVDLGVAGGKIVAIGAPNSLARWGKPCGGCNRADRHPGR